MAERGNIHSQYVRRVSRLDKFPLGHPWGISGPGVEDAVNPSLGASWRHPWRQDLNSRPANAPG
ncbi:hypothetical protein [Halorhodospira halochloris]|uniref:hypothetical protein n=1 Tax=Halorhodospira halochloris TaxID=1052 RepID=UPI0013A5B3E3|nr:hypothetical protein [Halorhodospira halochloris]